MVAAAAIDRQVLAESDLRQTVRLKQCPGKVNQHNLH